MEYRCPLCVDRGYSATDKLSAFSLSVSRLTPFV
jgi:hypothetical protein